MTVLFTVPQNTSEYHYNQVQNPSDKIILKPKGSLRSYAFHLASQLRTQLLHPLHTNEDL